MSHLDPEQLALLALGEPVASDDERAHLAACPACAAEVAEMAHAAIVARTTMAGGELEMPAGGVWDRIHGELALSSAVQADPLAAEAFAVVPSAADAHTADRPTPTPSSAGSSPAPLADAQLRPERRDRDRRTPRTFWMLAAAFALVAAVGSATWVIVASNLAPVAVATAALDSFPEHPGAAGTAEVNEDRDGARELTVTLDGAAASEAYREVWLIRSDGQALISLGILDASSGTFAIPAGVDLGEYDLVDISFEPVDGDPAHSGDSIVRGRLGGA